MRKTIESLLMTNASFPLSLVESFRSSQKSGDSVSDSATIALVANRRELLASLTASVDAVAEKPKTRYRSSIADNSRAAAQAEATEREKRVTLYAAYAAQAEAADVGVVEFAARCQSAVA